MHAIFFFDDEGGKKTHDLYQSREVDTEEIEQLIMRAAFIQKREGTIKQNKETK